MQNISKEDYLSTIYKHREKDGSIKANQIATTKRVKFRIINYSQ